jgi:SAM-dependent methyltransferase
MQKELWEKEYKQLLNLPSSRTMKPSRALAEFIRENQELAGRAFDAGSGKGRNSIYLAQHGYETVGVEMVRYAIEVAEQEARKAGVIEKVRFLEQSIGEPLPFKDESFDLIVDMMTLHLLNCQERLIYQREVVRLLKPGKFFLFYTLAAEGLAAQELFKSSPGPELNSYVIPQTGVVEKCFTEAELITMFLPLRVINLKRNTMLTLAFGGGYERIYYMGVMEKPIDFE